MTRKKPKKLTDARRAGQYYLRIGPAYIERWPINSVIDAYIAGLRAGRREKP